MEERINIRLDGELLDRLQHTAFKCGLSVSAYVRLAVIEKLNQDNPEKSFIFLEQFIKENTNG